MILTSRIVSEMFFLSFSLDCALSESRCCIAEKLSKIFFWSGGRFSRFWHVSGVRNQILSYSGEGRFGCRLLLLFLTRKSWFIWFKSCPFFILSSARSFGPISISFSSSCGERNWKTATCLFFGKVIDWSLRLRANMDTILSFPTATTDHGSFNSVLFSYSSSEIIIPVCPSRFSEKSIFV